MTRRIVGRVAITLALAATVLTSRISGAEPNPPQDTSSPPAAETVTPLALRPSKPLQLAQDPPHTGFGWKVVAGMVIVGVAALSLRKRITPRRPEDAQLTIVRRTAIGMRSELLVVNVEGQRLLIGVTPHSIQSLAVLDGDHSPALPVAGADTEDAAALEPGTVGYSAEEVRAGGRPEDIGPSVGERFAAMLTAADARGGAAALSQPEPSLRSGGRTGAKAAAQAEPADDGLLATQARGLMALRRRG